MNEHDGRLVCHDDTLTLGELRIACIGLPDNTEIMLTFGREYMGRVIGIDIGIDAIALAKASDPCLCLIVDGSTAERIGIINRIEGAAARLVARIGRPPTVET